MKGGGTQLKQVTLRLYSSSQKTPTTFKRSFVVDIIEIMKANNYCEVSSDDINP